ncbi:MAG TPA: hypothetical protein VLE22_02070 [Bryobacteraceae bacterium]|nr:hypothetical protein [Bryobacteraceae bacterium]
MIRRDFLRAAAITTLAPGITPALRADVPDHRWDGYDFGPAPAATDRLNQGPFGIDQDEGWQTIGFTNPSRGHVKNFGTGLVAYTWEEGGPSLAARRGQEPLEEAVEKLASLPFVDVLYIRCDWRDVQKQPGKLDLNPVWKLTLDAAKRHNLRVGFRVQLSSPNFQPKQLALPDFLQHKIPMVKIGRARGEGGGKPQDWDYVEPRYDHSEFQKAFQELNELLAAEFDGHPLLEFMDMMMYGFWGEGHTNRLPNPFPDYLTAEKTMAAMTRLQIDTWKKTPLAINTQPDISRTGNRECLDIAVRAGCWLRSDSTVYIEEPIQVECLSNRPQWLAVVMEEGRNRHYDPAALVFDAAGINDRENAALHVLDLCGNYWALWTEAENLQRFYEKYPFAFETLHRRLGYRVRPSFIWQRKRYGTSEIILGIANDGVAGVPGVLRVHVESMDGRVRVGGGLDGGHPHGGRLRQASFILPTGLEGQQVKLRAELETKGVRHPVRWTCAQPLHPDGSYVVQLKQFDDRGWRKGV